MTDITKRITLPREVVAEIIDNFDDLLDRHHITIPCPDRKDIDEPAAICGGEYDELMEAVIGTLKNWGIGVTDVFDDSRVVITMTII